MLPDVDLSANLEEQPKKEQFHIQRFPADPKFPKIETKLYWGSADSGNSGMSFEEGFSSVEEAFADILREARANDIKMIDVHVCQHALTDV